MGGDDPDVTGPIVTLDVLEPDAGEASMAPPLAAGYATRPIVARGSAPPRPRRDTAQPLDVMRERWIGRFELIRELARGGMGQVFLARDTKLGRKVAMKFLLRNDAQFVQRFIIEAQATARCTHDNIVAIHEVNEHRGLPYMVLEYLEGRTLAEVIAEKPSVRQFVELMLPVACALERASEHGIVHRDLKPANVFVTQRGQVKVLDFGIARLVDDARRTTRAMAALDPDALTEELTAANSIVGTLPYMAPEQWGVDTVDPRTDFWAFGIMFWRALAGVHPAGASKPDELSKRLHDLDTPLPSIATQVPTLAPELVAIVDRCLAMRKRDRFANATELVRALEAWLSPKAGLAGGETCPYRGLAPFAEDDAPTFFGRSNEIRTALAQLAAWPVLAVIGPSGVGKSSFIHAGLIPALREIHGSIDVRVLRPGRAPLHRLAAALEEPSSGVDVQVDVTMALVESPGRFGVFLREAALRRARRVVLVVDQLEELFTLCEDERHRHVFLTALLAAADDTSAPVSVVLSMRADFLDRLAAYPTVLAELSRGLFFLAPPDRDNLRDVIVRPAQLAGYTFEAPAIVDELVRISTGRGALPLLSFAASRLWEARDRQRRVLTTAAYQAMGGVGGAFVQHADQVAASFAAEHQLLLRVIMTRLVTPEGTRAVVEVRELRTLSTDAHEVDHVLDQLVRARLVHVHTDAEQVATAELVHEVLITAWPTLRRWLEATQAFRAFHQELGQAARGWAARNKPDELLWHGAIAQEALGHAERRSFQLNEIEREFVAAIGSRDARRRRRKLGALIAAFAVLGAVIAGGTFALVKIRHAEHDAREGQVQSERARAAAEAAGAKLKAQNDLLAEKERQRQAAEQEAKTATADTQLTREQLAEANKSLELQVAESQASEQRARKAQADAEAARAALERKAAAERAELEKLKAQAHDIVDGDLIKKRGKR